MLYANCECKNIQLRWHVAAEALVSRACQCRYCLNHNARYVSRPGSRIEVSVRNPDQHRLVRQGSGTADFHECRQCKQLVLVSSAIDGVVYGVINAACLQNQQSLIAGDEVSFAGESTEARLARRRQNWCGPVVLSHSSSCP